METQTDPDAQTRSVSVDEDSAYLSVGSVNSSADGPTKIRC